LLATAGNPAAAGGLDQIVTSWTPTQLASFIKLMVGQGDTLMIFQQGSDIVVRVT
jgi:hypothetical protein